MDSPSPLAALAEVGQEKNGKEDEEGYYECAIGEVLQSQYKVIQKLGEGQSCNVYECYGSGVFQDVAIKVTRGYREGLNEFDLLDYVRHQDTTGTYCVRMLSAFNHCKHLCLVFEKLGPSLDYLLQKNKVEGLSCDVISELGRQLLECVAFTHDTMDLIHTDLKPQNILFVCSHYAELLIHKGSDGLMSLPKSKAIKLIDFGSSVMNAGDDYEPYDHLIGTYPYRAPEVLLGLEWSFPCDMWSVGCILLEMFYSKPVFKSLSLIEQLAMMERFLGKVPEHMLDCHDPANKNSEKHSKWKLAHWQEISPRKNVEEVKNIPVLNDVLMKHAHDPVMSSFLNLSEASSSTNLL